MVPGPYVSSSENSLKLPGVWDWQFSQRTLELAAVGLFWGHMVGPQVQACSLTGRVFLLASAVFLSQDHSGLHCQKSADTHNRHKNSGLSVTDSPLPSLDLNCLCELVLWLPSVSAPTAVHSWSQHPRLLAVVAGIHYLQSLASQGLRS